ncbi:MAG: pirin family protein [Gammaproteobacteria bacterium]
MQRLSSRPKDLGGFTVRRVLPASERQKVGPFIFFDHMGPAEFAPGEGINVRPHPHIGLATVTYLFDGKIMHRDSLGVVQSIERGAVNLMTAGRGIVHSERAGDDLDKHAKLHGIQSWMALPLADEECAPEFKHYPAVDLPRFTEQGAAITLIIGQAFGHRSPVQTRAEMLYLDVSLAAGALLTLPCVVDEMGAYVVSGGVEINAQEFAHGELALAENAEPLVLRAVTDAKVMVIGGETLEKRHIWWNFVSSSQARIVQAKDDWRERRFDAVPGEDEFIPLP